MKRTGTLGVRWGWLVAAGAIALPLGACSTYSESGGSSNVEGDWIAAGEGSLREFRELDPALKRFFDSAYGYAVFPRITKGAVAVGAAHGKNGVVWEQGNVVGFATVTQVTLGVQLGGQSYQELIFFQTKADLDKFKANTLEFSANASAVAAASGAAGTADYADGVAVFVKPNGGLMFEASVGGQRFKFTPR